MISRKSSGQETGYTVPEAAVPGVAPEMAGPALDPAPRPSRRTFTAAYKLSVVEQYEAAPHGEKGAVLRREGLYHSHVKEWAAARDAGARPGPGQGRGAAGAGKDRENERLRAQNQRLTAQLAQTRTALDIMGKAHVLLEMLSESTDTASRPSRS